MAATGYSLRYLINRELEGIEEQGPLLGFQSALEKSGRAMRYALSTVQYYSPKYDYLSVVTNRNLETKPLFDGNELGK